MNANYHSYLLRLWRDDADHPWRAALQCTATGEKRAFADLPALLAFLVEELLPDEEPTKHASVARLFDLLAQSSSSSVL